MLPFVAPVFEVRIGQYVVRKVESFGVRSSAFTPVDVAEITVAPEVPVNAGDPVEIWQGYRERGMWLVFRGEARSVEPAGRGTKVSCRDGMGRLAGVAITQSFVHALPDAVVGYCLAKAGVQRARLGRARAAPRNFVASGESVLEVVRRVNRLWGLDWPYYLEPEGEFVWMPLEQTPRYQAAAGIVLEYGRSILAHIVRGNEGVLETIAVPWVRHSMRLVVRDPRYWEGERTVLAAAVLYRYGQGKARTVIEWRLPQTS